MRKILLLLLSFSSFVASAQQLGKPYEMLLKSGNFIPVENVKSFVNAPLKNQFVGEKYFTYLQFYSIPTYGQMQEMKSTGIEFLEYLPQNTYVVAIPSKYELNKLLNYNIRSVIDIKPSYKIAPELRGKDLPAHALLPNRKIALELMYYSNLQKSQVIDQINTLGFVEYSSTFTFGNRILVNVPVNKIDKLAEIAGVSYLQAIEPASTPDDREGRSLHRSSAINSDDPLGRHFDANGVSVAIADDGGISHIDFKNRLTDVNTGSQGGTHGDMVSGIAVGAGNLDPQKTGHATGAHLYLYDIGNYEHIADAPANFTNFGVVLSSTSYSQGTGGVYNNSANSIDNQLRLNPNLLHVFSAGNAGGAWSTITGGYKASKNVIATGNLENTDVLVATSSRGPAQDGRIKPDLCANGGSQLSTGPNNTYLTGGGTSAASPSLMGTTAQLYHAYRTLNNGSNPEGALIKGTLIATAEDLGNEGPDYIYGWGRINALKALRLLETNRYLGGNISQGIADTINVTIGTDVLSAKFTVYWSDYEGSANANPSLVNNINVTVVGPTGTVHPTWLLNPSTQGTAATTGIDNLNNTEQVVVNTPTPGTYRIIVTGATIPFGPQKYYAFWDFLKDEIDITYPDGGEGFDPGVTELIRWDATGNTGTFTAQYSVDSGSNWINIGTAVGSRRYIQWNPPTTAIGQNTLIKVSRGNAVGISEKTFTVVDAPAGLRITSICPDTVSVTWTAVAGATAYEVMWLGNTKMQPVVISPTNSAKIPGLNPNNDDWLSVRAIVGNGRGFRSLAINKPTGLNNCVLAVDAGIIKLNSPPSGFASTCLLSDSVSITVDLSNSGAAPLTNVKMAYSINNGPATIQFYTGPLAPSNTTSFSFNKKEFFGIQGNYLIKVWLEYPNDLNIYNDTLEIDLTVTGGIPTSLPLNENFDAMSSCPTTGNCEATVCNLTNGWINITNNNGDDIDFRVNSGTTPSTGTGPTGDHTSGNGNYLYTEATTCFNKSTVLLSPCIDLTTSVIPELSFWYHMLGTTMGSLHVDLLANDTVVNDIITPITGNSGSQWQKRTASLVPYIGRNVILRFRAVTGSDFESDIAIDDVSIVDNLVAAFTNNGKLCKDTTLMFESTMPNVPGLVLNWNFGVGAAPSVATGPGPHSVNYALTGSKTISLTATLGSIVNTTNKTINIELAPTADFNFTSNGTQVGFVDNSTGTTTWRWNFGDGVSSTQQNPTHTYPFNANYNVSLIVSNGCSTDTIIKVVSINVGIQNLTSDGNISLFPNPSNGVFNLEIKEHSNKTASYFITDALGKKVMERNLSALGANENLMVDLSKYSKGFYILHLSIDDKQYQTKLILK